MNGTSVVRFPKLGWIFNVNNVAFEFTMPFTNNVISIKWYGIIITFGFLLAVLFGGRMAYKWKINLDKMLDVLLYGTFGGIIGARLYYVAFEWQYYSKHPAEIFAVWNGGLAIYGGLIAGIIAAFIVCKKEKINFLNLLDMACMSFLIGQGIGRWGNFTNQEAFGCNTNLPWGMTSSKIASYIQENQSFFAQNGITADYRLPVHPTFLYESIWCLLGFALLYLICRKWRKFSGQLALVYGVWYGTERAFVEGLRLDSLYIPNTTIRVSQLLSAALAIVCLGVLIYYTVKYTKNPKPIEGVDYYFTSKGEKVPMDYVEPKDEVKKSEEKADEEDSEKDENDIQDSTLNKAEEEEEKADGTDN
ncbi:MAG: prolipoprotein diacylglyceryl transferase [Clostridiales bacterium]|nr:prolipoprotein diacylglyceryl transferase [Clostridiales bacterium]